MIPTFRLAVFALLLSGCSSRAPLPDVRGDFTDVVVRAAFGDGVVPAGSRLVLDSISFGRLAQLAGENGPDGPWRMVDPDDVLECPDREPCRLADADVYVTVWDAVREGDRLDATVTRTANVQRLYLLTESTVYALTLVRDPAGWRLVSRSQLPN